MYGSISKRHHLKNCLSVHQSPDCIVKEGHVPRFAPRRSVLAIYCIENSSLISQMKFLSKMSGCRVEAAEVCLLKKWLLGEIVT